MATDTEQASKTEDYLLYRTPNHGISSQQDATIMELRWEAQGFKFQLWQKLAGRVPVFEDGQIKLVREYEGVTPLMNDVGASRVITLVEGLINSSIALSSIQDSVSRSLQNDVLQTLTEHLHLHMEEYEIKDATTVDWVAMTLTPLIVCQLNRPVNGHESKNSRTVTQELKQETFAENRTSGSGFLNPFKRGGRR